MRGEVTCLAQAADMNRVRKDMPAASRSETSDENEIRENREGGLKRT